MTRGLPISETDINSCTPALAAVESNDVATGAANRVPLFFFSRVCRSFRRTGDRRTDGRVVYTYTVSL